MTAEAFLLITCKLFYFIVLLIIVFNLFLMLGKLCIEDDNKHAKFPDDKPYNC